MSRQYLRAGHSVEAVLNGRSFKSYCAQNKLSKTEYALASETLKHLITLTDLFHRVGVDVSNLDCNGGIFLVMAFELFFGKKKISGGGAVKRRLLEYKSLVGTAIDQMMNERRVDRIEMLVQTIDLPTYIRVNELKMSRLDGLRVVNKHSGQAYVDSMIPSLIVLPPKTSSLGEHELVQGGSLVIQDKASCFPSQILSDYWQGGDIIDATAAPGNKTSHIASEIYQKAHYRGENIYAFDKDIERAKLLKQRMQLAGASFVQTTNDDFLRLDVLNDKFKDVRSILCDPSCSGSGGNLLPFQHFSFN